MAFRSAYKPARKRFLPGKKWKVAIAFVLLALLAGVYPYDTTVVPAWKLRIVDETGNPYPNMPVTQAWKDYTLEIEAGQNLDTRSTNPDGYVQFPERKIRASFIRKIFLTALSSLMTLAHGSFGVHVYVHASGPQGYSEIKYEPGKPVPGQLVLSSKE